MQPVGGELDRDEGIRADTSAERLALPPAFTEAGTITGNASQLSDAAAAGLVTGLQTARETGIEPLAEIVGRAVVAGPDSTLHLRPAEASEKLLAAQRLTAADIDLWEINEAFAGVALASIDALGIDAERVNVNGGAIAVGHPLAASGFRLVLTRDGAPATRRHPRHRDAVRGRRTGRSGPPTQALMQPSGEWTPLLRVLAREPEERIRHAVADRPSYELRTEPEGPGPDSPDDEPLHRRKGHP